MNAANKSACIIDNSRRNSEAVVQKRNCKESDAGGQKISFMYSNGRPERTLPEGLMIPLKVKMEKRGLQMVLYTNTLFRARKYAFFAITGIYRGILASKSIDH